MELERFKFVHEVFYSEDSGYTVIKVRKGDEKGEITLVGNFLPRGKGIEFKASTEKVNTNYGVQYKVTYFEEIEPDNKDSIIAYIIASKLKGIGPKKAEAIYNQFGDDTLKVLDSNFSEIKKVKGLSSANCSACEKKWKESRSLRNIMKTIGSDTGLSQNKLLTLHEKFGNKLEETIKYRTYDITKINGITFAVADKIAKKQLNYDPSSDERIKSCIRQCLLDAMQDGHLFLTPNQLIYGYKTGISKREGAYRILNNGMGEVVVDAKMLNDVILNLCKRNDLRKLDVNGNLALYLDRNFKNEEISAKKIVSMMKNVYLGNAKIVDEKKVEKIIKKIEKQENIKLAEKQKHGVMYAIKYPVSIIIGGPGRGKTTTLNTLTKTLEEYFDPKPLMCLGAPTGRAARRITESTGLPANTIHSILEIRGDEADSIDADSYLDEPLDADVIIIDEMSMVDMNIFSKLVCKIKDGAKLILVGDKDQLPSVGAGNVLAELIKSKVIPTTELDVPFRQSKENLIYSNIEKINKGETDLSFDKDSFISVEAHGAEEISKICEKIYKAEYDRLKDFDKVWCLTPFRKSTLIGANELNLALRQMVNPLLKNKLEISRKGRTYRIRDRVMQLKNVNDSDGVLSNGDMGIVIRVNKSITDDESSVVVDFGDELGSREYVTSEDFENLDLAYASTIHKSQGSECEVVIMPMSKIFSGMLKRNLVYTGISRAKKRVYIVGDVAALNMAIRDNSYAARNTLFAYRLYGEAMKIKMSLNKQKENEESNSNNSNEEFKQLSITDYV